MVYLICFIKQQKNMLSKDKSDVNYDVNMFDNNTVGRNWIVTSRATF